MQGLLRKPFAQRVLVLVAIETGVRWGRRSLDANETLRALLAVDPADHPADAVSDRSIRAVTPSDTTSNPAPKSIRRFGWSRDPQTTTV